MSDRIQGSRDFEDVDEVLDSESPSWSCGQKAD
jgi:hypothetical protein